MTPLVLPLLVEPSDAELPERAWAPRLLPDIASFERACDAAQLAPFRIAAATIDGRVLVLRVRGA